MSRKKQFLLRIDTKLYTTLGKWAMDEFRSINGQIEYLLHKAVKKAGRIKTDPVDDSRVYRHMIKSRSKKKFRKQKLNTV
jgi:hypothetical protein